MIYNIAQHLPSLPERGDKPPTPGGQSLHEGIRHRLLLLNIGGIFHSFAVLRKTIVMTLWDTLELTGIVSVG